MGYVLRVTEHARLFLCILTNVHFTFNRDLSAKNHDQVIKFKVRDRDHVIGVVLLNVSNLDGRREASKRWWPLSEYKKVRDVSGDLLIECFVSAYRSSQLLSAPDKHAFMHGSLENIFNSSKKLRNSFRSPSWSRETSNLAVTATVSSGDVADGTVAKVSTASSSERSFEPEHEMIKSVRNRSNNTIASSASFQSHSYLSSNESFLVQPASPGRNTPSTEWSLHPVVTGVCPREGPVGGGQRVVLRGSNLGEDREDIVKVLIADVDCTRNMEYISSSKQPSLPSHIITALLLIVCQWVFSG